MKNTMPSGIGQKSRFSPVERNLGELPHRNTAEPPTRFERYLFSSSKRVFGKRKWREMAAFPIFVVKFVCYII